MTKDEIIAKLHRISRDITDLKDEVAKLHDLQEVAKPTKYAIGHLRLNGTVAFVAGPYDTLNEAKYVTPETYDSRIYSIEPDKGECVVAIWDYINLTWSDV